MAVGESFTETTGIQNIDALLFGTRWNTTNLTYAFPITGSYYPSAYEHEPGNFDDRPARFLTVTPQLADAFRAATRQFAAVSGLRFTEVGADAQAELTAARTVLDFTADARFPTWSNEGDVWFNSVDYNLPVPGNYAWTTVLHEIGHTLGLKHGHQDSHGTTHQALTPAGDSMEFTVMTYRSYAGGDINGYTNEGWGYAQTVMMYDIAAIQHLYGANFATNAGNTVYRFSPATGEMFINGVAQGRPGANRIFLTIWDGNGIDTYDFSNYTTGLQISLVPGNWSLLSTAQRANLGGGHFARANVYNALQYNSDPRSLIDNANGGAGSDAIGGNQAANTLNGNGGNDTLIGNGGNDRLFGGAGNDMLRGDCAPSGLGFGTGYVTLPSGTANNTREAARNLTGNFTLANDPDIANSTAIPHTTVNATGNGSAAYYVVALKAGMTITVDIDHSADVDTYVRITSANGVVLMENDDTVRCDPGSTPYQAEIRTQDSALSFTVGQDGNYYVVVGSFDEATRDFAASIPTGATYELNISASASGRAGNDSLYGGPGADLLYGDGGNDMLAGGAGADRLFGGAGLNTASYAMATAGVIANLANPTTNTGEAMGDTYSAIHNLLGSAHADRLSGNAGTNLLNGLGGHDVLAGGAAGDRLIGGAGIDTASYAGASRGVVASLARPSVNTGDAKGDVYVAVENLVGSRFGDVLAGNAYTNGLYGSLGRDRLAGGGGNDRLDGGAHNDILSGGAGNDVFIFTTAPSATNIDVITDFDVADTIRLENAVFTALTARGTLSPAAFWKSSAGVAHDADDHIIYDSDSGRLFYDANGNAAGGAVPFARIGANLALTHADFFVV